MAGGNKNIKPEDGKQFSKEYQPAQKWTEKVSLKLGNDLITWLKAEDENIFFEEFLYMNNDFYPELISYLSSKFTSFLKLIEKAKKIQELKLIKFGVFDKLNATMTKFVLTNHHDYSDRSEVKTESTNEGETITVIVQDADKAKELKEMLDK